ncbi:DUF192 domain-containing protein [Pseudokordiimonas caeni]|uniref:DUF192 domain-containing protein n=1 Tax=Pseudokordiimonas caeni TaxID=2997908 RepID=UPI002810BF7D|nr:DUF192 domain-containing protein [Pseudokordiimonas caeni]
MLRIFKTLLAGFCFLAVAALPLSAGEEQGPLSPLAVLKADGTRIELQVETATDDASRAEGLMFRTHMAPDHGMLFIFEEPVRAQFWMRNTLIPLDMLFIRTDGRVANIIANAEPQTDDPRPSKGRVIGVLELAGGRAAELGIKPGDRILHGLLAAGE